MKSKWWFLFLMGCLLFISETPSLSAQVADNTELQKMKDEDQSQRKNMTGADIDLWKEDSLRRVRLHELIREGKVITANDHYNAALIFQHGTDTVDSGNAVAFMKKAIELNPAMDKWLLAAAIDRDLMRKGKPQIYGTQYVKSKDGAKWVLYETDTTAVTDEERLQYRVGTIAQQRERERRMNLLSIYDYSAEHGSVDETIELIRSEFAKGKESSYDVSEAVINAYGYEFLNANLLEVALKVFKLNTELYPLGYNTWDSLGECYLLLGKKRKGIKAYRKSLDLEPANENARKIIDAQK
ncbi:MAG: tetratricopeptide repeat protein [Flavobacteriales bacterium]|nr:tetratricopeptide repeat protein [Flavobacteriales bacterium]